jgi:hypothetical protein
MRTAVEWLHSEYERILGSVLVTPQQIIEMSDALENGKEIEKEQMEECWYSTTFGSNFEHYYNVKFKQQEQ